MIGCVQKLHTSFFYKEIKSQFYNYVISSIIRIKLISTPGGRFPRARLQSPRANRMLVTKALPHDVAYLAFVPFKPFLRGFQLALFPLESPPCVPINKSTFNKRKISYIYSCFKWKYLIIKLNQI